MELAAIGVLVAFVTATFCWALILDSRLAWKLLQAMLVAAACAATFYFVTTRRAVPALFGHLNAEQRRALIVSEYLTASELAELVGCKANQRAVMASWLTSNRWSYVVAMNGLPRVLREYRNRKLGLIDEHKTKARLEASPNVDAFRRSARTYGGSASV